ncbi:MAG TPA: flagellar biosynthetic protein FliO [Gallionella sp.]|nr:flagellar biosynthetic protein FliO [Gallionella sp.]
MRTGLRTTLATVALVIPTLAAAVEGTRPTYTPPPPAVSSGSIVQIIFSLLLVLAAIVLVAWLLKRMNMVQQGHGNLVKVLGGVAIGQRERIVLVEVNDTWLVVGVGPNQIRTLHSLEKPEGSSASATPEDAQLAGNKFSAVLSSALNSLSSGKRNAS